MKKGYSSEEIIRKLRQAEVLLHDGKVVTEAFRELGITDSTYYKWRKEYGGMKMGQAKWLKELERENGRLRRVVADLTLDKLILQMSLRESIKPRAQASGGLWSDAALWYLAASRLRGTRGASYHYSSS
jgi:putative transposase